MGKGTGHAMETSRINVRTRELEPLLRLEDELFRGDPSYIPRSLKARIAPYKPIHPFYRHGEAAHFAVRSGRRVLGRMSAIVDGRLQQRIGWFGLAVVRDDSQVTANLLDAVETFLRGRGVPRMMGPVDLTIWHSCRIQTGGARQPRYVVEPQHPPYFEGHLRGHGLEPMRRFACHEYASFGVEESRATELQQRVRSHGYRIRPLDTASLERDLNLIHRISSSCFADSLGFVPLSRREFHLLYRDMARHVPPDMVQLAETGRGEVVGFAFSLPDLGGPLRHLGRGGPLSKLRAARARRRISAMIFKTLAVLEDHRGHGLASAMAVLAHQAGWRRGYRTTLQGFFDLDNDPSVRASKACLTHGAATSREYAILGREF